jgi:hypothetical protein
MFKLLIIVCMFILLLVIGFWITDASAQGQAAAYGLNYATRTPLPPLNATQQVLLECASSPWSYRWMDNCPATATAKIIPYPGNPWEGCIYPAYPGDGMPVCPNIFAPAQGGMAEAEILVIQPEELEEPTPSPTVMKIARPQRRR